MEISVKTNRLAIVSFVSGLIGLFSLGLTLFPVLFPPSPENLPEPTSPINIFMDLSRSVRDLGALVALLTGILALREIKRNAGTEKGKILAWVGIILGGGWILFRVLVAIFFILALIFSGP